MGIKDIPRTSTWRIIMSRKRTPDEKSTESSTDATPAETGTAVAEPPAAETSANKPTFAERVGQRKWVAAPDPFGIASDSLAGVRLFESKQDRQMALKFEEKPSQAVIDKLKDAGYHWNPVDKIWAHPVRSDSAMSTRIEAERLYQEVRQQIRADRGIDPGQEVPF
jgi:hypothetical protein